jgi:glutamate formiminotransferase
VTLLTVPNLSEGRNGALVDRLGLAFEAAGAERLDTHSDPIHNRSVFTLAGEPEMLVGGIGAGAEAATKAIDMRDHVGAHPCIGALDVAPLVWLEETDIEPAEQTARDVAEALANIGIPVFFYGGLASSPERAERAFFRSGGLAKLRERMAEGLAPDFGPSQPHPTAGAALVTARPPIAAFNLRLATEDGDAARLIASQLRESGGGPAGVRAIGIEMRDGTVQVSTNVHDPIAMPLREVVDRVRQLAEPHGIEVASAEIVALVPAAAMAGFPDDLPLPGFDPARHLIESRIAASG